MKKLLFAGLCSIVMAAWSAPVKVDFTPHPESSDIYRTQLNRIWLSGWWKFKKIENSVKGGENDIGTQQKWFAPGFNDSAWGRSLVPENLHLPFEDNNPSKEVRNWGGIAWFRRSFDMPAVKKDQRVFLVFEQLVGDFTIYINGQKAFFYHYNQDIGNNLGAWYPTRYDVTKFVKQGKNSIALKFFHNGKTRNETWGTAPAMGILQNTWVEVRPAAWTWDILIDTKENLKDIHAECLLEGSNAGKDTTGWTAEITEYKSGRKAASGKFGKPFVKDGLNRVAMDLTIPNAKTWSPESPFLYMMTVRNNRGEIVGAQRFGVRTFISRNGDFLLNGKPTMLCGVCEGGPLPHGRGFDYATAVNEGKIIHRYYQMFKELNINHFRLHSHRSPAATYDVLDELGFIITDEINYPMINIKNPKRSDEIAIPAIQHISKPDGTLTDDYVKTLKKRIHYIYSRPSICTFSFGNEIRNTTDRTGRMLNNTLKLYRKVDTQKRPLTISSGRFWKAGNNIRELYFNDGPIDYIDPHDYTGSINSSPVAFVKEVAEHFIKEASSYYKPMLPIVNGETVYANSHYYDWIYHPIWAKESNAQPNWKLVENLFNEWNADPRNRPNAMMSFHWVRNAGMKNYIYHRVYWRGIITDQILAPQRALFPQWDGFENLSTEPFTWPKELYPFDKSQFVKGDDFDLVREVNAPAIGFFDINFAPNRWSGETMNVPGLIVNNHETPLKNAIMKVTIKMNGKEMPLASVKVGFMATNTKKAFPIKFKFPNITGSGQIFWRVYDGNKLENTRYCNLNLRQKKSVLAPIKTNKKIAVYDASAVFAGLGVASTTELLEDFGIKATQIEDFKDIKKYDLLIIGKNSMNDIVENAAEEIRAFVQNGGRLLAFEQLDIFGRIPYLPELSYTKVGPGQFTEILKFDHPAFKGMNQTDFAFWNSQDKSIYHSYVYPVSRAALNLAGDASEWGSDNFGMASCHLRLGKGDILLSQNEVTQIYKQDSAAAQFTRNVLEAMVNDATRAAATTFRSLGMPKHSTPKAGKTVAIDFRNAATRGFADKMAGDCKGGWTDQGPRNDLRGMKPGNLKAAGVPFTILDPAKNNGKSVVMVATREEQKLAAKSKPISVNLKVKKLYFLHAGAWLGTPKNVVVGRYIVTYASGKKAEIPLHNEVEIGDFWGVAKDKLEKATCGWVWKNPGGVIVGLSVFEWKNPNANDTVKTVEFECLDNTILGLVGLTAEKL